MFLMSAQRSVASLLAVLLMLFALAACGTAETGGAPNAPSAQPSAERVPIAQPAQTSPTSAPEPTSASGAGVSHGGLVKEQVSLIDALRKAGATVESKEQIEQSFLSVEGTQLLVNGADVQVFEYVDEAAAQADTAMLADVLAGRGTTMVAWVASPHAYQAGHVIALYVGDDAEVLKLLQDMLGAPFAGQQLPSLQKPTTDPAAPTAVSHGARQVTDLVSLIDHLRASGLDVQPAGAVEQPFFDVAGKALKVNGADVQVFEFADAEAAKAAVATIGPDGNPPKMMIEWVAPPHFYQSGEIVVLYVGADAAITQALESALGEQVAGR